MSNHTLKATAIGSVSALALAAMSTTAHADGPEIYGAVDIGLESYSADDEVLGFIFSGFNSVDNNPDQKDFTLSNGFQSRLGVRGGEDLSPDLRVSYTMEFAVDVLVEPGGATESAIGNRLGWVALGGDWGLAKVGSQWMPLYEFGGWNTHRTDVHGYGTYFYTTGVLRDSLAFGFRQSSAISYQYGSAWGHSDPFAFNITAGIGEGEENESGISSIQVAGQYSFNDAISINAVAVQEIVEVEPGVDDDEATLFNVGARWNVIPQFELAANYTLVTDYDDADSERDSIALAGYYDFGQGWDSHLGVSRATADDVADIDFNVYGFVRYAFTDRTSTRLELEHIAYDADANDATETIGLLAVQHSF